MQFRKIDEHKIHCIISQEEMSQKGIQIEDFLDHRDKTEAFLREILAEAKYELNLDEDMGRCFSVQMAVMPEGDVSLVISGEDHGSTEETLTEFGKRLQDFKEIMEEAKRKLDVKKEKLQKEADALEGVETEEAGLIAEEEKTTETSPQEQAPQEAKKERTVLNTPIWVAFSNLDDCISACHHLQSQKGLSSAAYKYKDTYYLRFQFSEEEHQVAGVILVVSEYGKEILTDDHGGAVIAEHGNILCKENAVETLARL